MPTTSTPRKRSAAAALAAILAVAAGALAPAATATAAPGQLGSEHASAMPPVAQHPVRRACSQPATPGLAACMALVRTDVTSHAGLFAAAAAPAGYGPADLKSAYDLPSGPAGSGETVAVVDAFDDPNAEADLGVYRAQFGLPPCTTANGCFEKVNQEGQQGSYPPPDSGWAEEESLDVDMVSAICPDCHILLVEATDNSDSNLAASASEAVTLGAGFVSNSYSTAAEDPSETSLDQFYNHPGVVVTASADDLGYGPVYPAASPYVTSVGGTSLVRDTSVARGWAESVWGSASGGEGTGSGCSAFEAKPSWQADTGCPGRTIADVSAVADPDTGVAVYDSYQFSGWDVFGGTSVSSPVIASTYALAGTPQAGTYPARYPYDAVLAGAANQLNDVTTGANGTCTPAYLCTAGPGYDGPTGLGTPEGTGAFTARQSGTLSGTVTDAATGQPVAGAVVAIPAMSVTTGSDGSYSMALPVASYQVTVSDYGYQTQSVTLTVTANTATTRNFQLTGTPHETVSGKVTAGTGTPWPLYAQVSWSDGNGHQGTAFTDPATGAYAVSLLADASYTLRVTPLLPGYQSVTEQITVGSGAVTENVALPVDLLACTAIGYHPVLSGATQPFDAASGPAGWAVSNTSLHYPGYADQPGWVFTNPGARPNDTGGTGGFAIVDSDHDGQFHYQDTKLISPAVSFAADKSPVVQFATDLEPAVNSAAAVDVSADGGKTWTSAWRNAGFPGDPGPATVIVPLPQAAGASQVRVRFDYTGQWSQWWEIDNVFLGNRACVQQSGGLLTGRVTDATGTAIDGAAVASVTNPGQSTLTGPTPGDDAIGGGLYELFVSATGSQRFTASMTGFAAATQATSITAGQVSALNFTLTAPGTLGAARAAGRRPVS